MSEWWARYTIYVGAGLAVVITLIILFYVSNSGIEGRYEDKIVAWLDGATHYIELKDGDIIHCSYTGSFSNITEHGPAGTYRKKADGNYELHYNLRGHKVSVVVQLGFYGLKMDERSAVKTDLALPNYSRMFFWDFW